MSKEDNKNIHWFEWIKFRPDGREGKVKVRLDEKTIVYIKLSSFDRWKRLYPDAKILK